MPFRATHRRALAALACLSFASLLSCGRELTGLGGPDRRAEVVLDPVFSSITLGGDGRVLSIGDVVDFTRVRVVLLRADGDTAVDRLVEFHPDSESVRLAVNITMSGAATSEGEPLSATLKYINATGDTVFTGGPTQVIARTSNSGTTPPQIPVVYTGQGANAASISIAPTSHVGVINGTVSFSATVRDSSGAPLGAAPVAFTSTDSARVRVDLRTGAATLLGARGTAGIIAQTLTGQADTADVTIDPTPSAIVLVSGGNQQVRQGETFPLPVRVRVNAADGLGVAGVPVSLVATRGQGSTAPTIDTTDANGIAEALWTAGDSAGVGQLNATVIGRPLNVVVNGTQLSSSPTAITWEVQPVNFTSGDSLAPVTVVVRDATGDTVSNFSGNVALELTGGTGGAALLGITTREAVNGVATFNFLTIDRAGTAYRLRATVNGVPPALSSTFDVAAAPPRYVSVTGGANQTAPALTVLPDSVRVRVTNTFGQPVAGVALSWAVVSGGGTITPTNATTDADGRAAAQWTLGAAGAQQARALVAGLPAALVNASIFTPTGTPTLFAGVDALSMTIASTRSVPVYLSPADVAPVVAHLTVLDTLIADWSQDSVVFTPGATLRSPTLVGRGAGTTQAVITSTRGVDTVQVSVALAALQISGDLSSTIATIDTLRKTVRLTAPAPAGGLQVQVATSDPSVFRIAPTSGARAPSDRCYDYYCYDDADPTLAPASGATGSVLLAPPADTILLTIPEGEAMAFFAIVPVDTGNASISVTAPNHATDARNYTIEVSDFELYNYYGTQVTLGSRTEVEVYLGRRLTHDLSVRLRSTDTTVLRVDSLRMVPAFDNYAEQVRPRAVGLGSAYLIVEADGFVPDSLLLDVVAPHLWISDRGPVLAIGQSLEITTSTSTDAFGGTAGYWTRDVDLPLLASSSDTAVLTVSLSGRIDGDETYGHTVVQARAAGTAWLRIGAADHGTDSVLVTVQSSSLYLYDNNFRVGVGQLHNSALISLNYSTSSAGDVIRRIDIESSDPAIATVLTPTRYGRAGTYFESPLILGVSEGTVTLRFAGPGIDTTYQSFTVSAPRLEMTGVGGTGGTFDPDSSSLTFTSYTSDGFGSLRPVADTVTATLRSTNPSVLLVTDSIIRFTPGQYFSHQGVVRFLAPGTAQLVLSADGYTPDTSGLFTLRPPRIDIQSTFFAAGRGLAYEFGFFRRSPTSAPLPFTVTTSGPADVEIVQVTDTMPAGASFDRFYFRTGSAIGFDTIVVSAAGHTPDTLRVEVTPSIARPVLVSSAPIGDDIEVSARLDRIGLNGLRTPADTVLLLVSTPDTALVDIVDDTIRLAPEDEGQAYRTATVRFRRPGTARFIVSDPTAFFRADSAYVIGRMRSLSGSESEIDMGQRQQTSYGELYVYRDYNADDSLWVRFTSSAPTIARAAQDSVLLEPGEYYAYFEVISGDTVGGAIITASAPGFAEMQTFVGVTRGVVTVYLDDNQVALGDSTVVDAYLTSARGYQARATLEPVPLRLRSETPGLVSIGADSLTTIPAGEYYSTMPFGPVRAIGTGFATVRLEDSRVGSFRRYEHGVDELEVRTRKMTLNQTVFPVGVGLRTDLAAVQFEQANSTGQWIQLRSLGGRFSTLEDSVFRSAGDYNVSFPLVGLLPGIDTLVVSEPGHTPDTAVVNIGPGVIRLDWATPVLRSGDSVLVSLQFMSPGNDYSSTAGAPRTLTFATTGPVQILESTAATPTTTVVVPPDTYTVYFWVKATGSGDAEIVITSPGLLEARVRVRLTTLGVGG